MRHGVVLQGDGAAGGQHGVFTVQRDNDLLFHHQKALRAQFIYGFLQELAGLLLDGKVGIEKRHPQRLGAEHAHGALAAARHADQYEILIARHG